MITQSWIWRKQQRRRTVHWNERNVKTLADELWIIIIINLLKEWLWKECCNNFKEHITRSTMRWSRNEPQLLNTNYNKKYIEFILIIIMLLFCSPPIFLIQHRKIIYFMIVAHSISAFNFEIPNVGFIVFNFSLWITTPN